MISQQSVRRLFLPALSLCSVLVALSGCASYYSHYGMFPAENSAGEERQVMLSWQTAEYPDWWLRSNQSTPIKVVTQCSSRDWRLADSTHQNSGECAEGIRACGEAGQDLIAATGAPADEENVCLSVNPGEDGSNVTDIGQSLMLQVSCRPARTTQPDGDETENIDYLRASSVPYKVYIRKAPRGTLNGRPPAMDDSVCDAE
ncbi:MAG: hypothetical protein ACQEV6_17460 [Pseudomonadota bacterium]